MIRKIIKIDESLCNGCGLCAEACHEGAIGMVDGVAKLLRDDYCDGLGDCLPACPTNAISFEEREAAAYDQEAVNVRLKELGRPAVGTTAQPSEEPKPHAASGCSGGGCPGSNAHAIHREAAPTAATATAAVGVEASQSQLRNWPVQIKLAPLNAPYYEGANLLIAADCAAYAYANFHAEFMRNKLTLIGCPKLDAVDYAEKLTHIIRENNVKSVTIVRMEVPCCGGLENAVVRALKASEKMIPWQVVTISTDGKILEEEA